MTILENREEAGEKLAQALKEYKSNPRAIVLGLPRGGVVVAARVARELGLPLDIVVTRKIGAPGNPEYAIGALAQTGEPIWNEEETARLDKEWLKKAVEKERAEARRRLTVYRAGRPRLNLKDKIAILVDDGIATGYTMRAAVGFVKSQKPSQVVVAVPHGAADSLKLLRAEADRVVALEEPEWYGAVGAFYEDFSEVTDEVVIKLMKD